MRSHRSNLSVPVHQGPEPERPISDAIHVGSVDTTPVPAKPPPSHPFSRLHLSKIRRLNTSSRQPQRPKHPAAPSFLRKLARLGAQSYMIPRPRFATLPSPPPRRTRPPRTSVPRAAPASAAAPSVAVSGVIGRSRTAVNSFFHPTSIFFGTPAQSRPNSLSSFSISGGRPSPSPPSPERSAGASAGSR